MPHRKQVNRSTHLTSVFLEPGFLVLSDFLGGVPWFRGRKVWKSD